MSATISPCGTYRYTLGRIVNPLLVGRHVALIGVNPSTADAQRDDATIRKELGFAARLGWAEITKVNLFAYRATDVRELAKAADPVGPRNNEYIEWALANNPLVVACWGPLAKLPKHLRSRWLEVVGMADRLGRSLYCFGTAQDGQPRHPLMLAYGTPLVPWKPPASRMEAREGQDSEAGLIGEADDSLTAKGGDAQPSSPSGSSPHISEDLL